MTKYQKPAGTVWKIWMFLRGKGRNWLADWNWE